MDNLLTHYCPFCKNELVYREFYGVWGLYCSCGYKFPDRINDREITEDELIQFEKNGFSPIIRFTTKNGKPCKLRLVLDKKERKVTYAFEK